MNTLPAPETPPRGTDPRPVAVVIGKKEAMGDALVRIAAHRALRTALPGHRIVHVSALSAAMQHALKALAPQLVDEVIVDQPLRKGPAFLRQLILSIGNVETVIDLRPNLGSLWTYLATAGLPIRFVSNTAFFGLRRRVGGKYSPRPYTNAERYHRCVELIARRTLPFDPTVPVGDGARRAAARLIPEGERYMLLSPGVVTSPKSWPVDRWAAVARHLAGRGVRPVFLIGPLEPTHRAWIERDVPEALIVDQNDVTDRGDLPWLFHALASRSLGCVAVESGIGHLMAASSCPVLTICGATRSTQWRPATPRSWMADSREFGSREVGRVPLSVVIDRVDEIIAYMDRLVPPAAFVEGAETILPAMHRGAA